MWLATNRGFYSVVAYDARKGGEELSGPHVLVRTRMREHLEVLKATVEDDDVSPTPIKVEIATDPTADYMFRTIIPLEWWQGFVLAETERIDYGNFKNSVKDDTLHSAYMSIWGIMHRLQPIIPFKRSRRRRKSAAMSPATQAELALDGENDESERFSDRAGGKCESYMYVGLQWCHKRARWTDHETGLILCGEHKQEVEEKSIQRRR